MSKFQVCGDCSGSTGPTCTKNQKCIGSPTKKDDMFSRIFKWNEDQARDENGRWTSSGGAADAQASGTRGQGSHAQFPPNWDKGFSGDLAIGAGGKETPFISEGQWKLRVFDKKQQKHYLYNYHTDMLEEEERGPYQGTRIGFQLQKWDQVFKFNPDQTRAKDGKWFSDGHQAKAAYRASVVDEKRRRCVNSRPMK